MPIETVYGLDPHLAAGAARAGAAGVAQREASQFGAQMSMRDRHFYDGMANDRGMTILRAQLGQLASQRENAQRMEYGRMVQAAQMQEMERKNELERENTEWTYTKEQEHKQKQYQKELELVDTLQRTGEFDEFQVRNAKYQINAKLAGIQPTAAPKANPLEHLPVVEQPGPDGTMRRYRIGTDRSGVPKYIPEDPTELEPKLAAKREADAEKLKLAQEKETYVRQQKAEEAILRREELAMKRYELLTKPVPTADGMGSAPRMDHEKAMLVSGLNEFIKQEPKTGQFDATKRPPKAPPNAVFIQSSDDAAFDRLPPGTFVYDENGNGGVK